MKTTIALLTLLLASCSSTPVPTGDRIVSISWLNQGPNTYTLVETTLCSRERSVSLEGLPAYTEKALLTSFDLTHNCKISVQTVIGSTQLQKQTNWVPSPIRESASREYHLQIRVLPNAPPILKLETVEAARLRIQGAGRIFEE